MKPRFTYTVREWEFLELAATWSGYFVPRQFCHFLGGSPGAVSHAFLQKLLHHRHASLTTHARNTHLYHLCARPLYAALDQEHNRHRRKRPSYQVRAKLMALDFVLAHRELGYLTTEDEKVQAFLQLGVPKEALPQRHYTAKNGTSTTRHFLDKFPLFRAGNKVSFTFISGDAPSRSPFETYLDEYWSLFSALEDAPVLYVASRAELAMRAQAELSSYTRRRLSVEPRELVNFFALRKRHEERGSELSIAELRTLRAGLQSHQSRSFESLYRAWTRDPQVVETNHSAGPCIRLEPAVLLHHYDLFGDL